ncbi:paired amphipathic helix protein Sin3a isoform X2 [Nilaparvata lugens]|uniref:paired amphipathic helix protein Sin3a isoform X2 n=1 Tax=Nilaparvata lugens TaxID=108931 RepID=UPI00193E235D|nr:paired amphipathic helix protein Sin3a isoform X2 [Nilaparvata lugens]
MESKEEAGPSGVVASASASAASVNTPHPRMTDSTAYITSVKNTFKHQPSIYYKFVDILKSFETTKTSAVVESVTKLFENHPELLLGFNDFLPESHKIQVVANTTTVGTEESAPSPPIVDLDSDEATTSADVPFEEGLPLAELSLEGELPPPAIEVTVGNDQPLAWPVLPASMPVVSEPVLNIREVTSAEDGSRLLVAIVEPLNIKDVITIPSCSPPSPRAPSTSAQSPIRATSPRAASSSTRYLIGHSPRAHSSSTRYIRVQSQRATSPRASSSSASNPRVQSPRATSPRATSSASNPRGQSPRATSPRPPSSRAPNRRGRSPRVAFPQVLSFVIRSPSAPNPREYSLSAPNPRIRSPRAPSLSTPSTSATSSNSRSASAVSSSARAAGDASSLSVPSISAPDLTATKPLEFDDAIVFIAKVKKRFSRKPKVYSEFLNILHYYSKQKKQDPSSESNLDEEMNARIAQIFRKHDDLLQNFSKFFQGNRTGFQPTQVPRGSTSSAEGSSSRPSTNAILVELLESTSQAAAQSNSVANSSTTNQSNSLASSSSTNQSNSVASSSSTNQGESAATSSESAATSSASSPFVRPMDVSRDKSVPLKKRKLSLIEPDKEKEQAEKEQKEWDELAKKIRELLTKPQEYDNFLRCLKLFNEKIVTRRELVDLTTPLLRPDKEVLVAFKQLLGMTEEDESVSEDEKGARGGGGGDDGGKKRRSNKKELEEASMEIDCPRLGPSYCSTACKKEQLSEGVQEVCSGRTRLCDEVLNDEWRCSPVWPDDDADKPPPLSPYDELVFGIEDQRFEIDVVMETNLNLMRLLEYQARKLRRMTIYQQENYTLDDTIGGGSPPLIMTAIRRLYGDVAPKIYEYLKRHPVLGVPVLLGRLKQKDEEWRTAQKLFNKKWREDIEEFYRKTVGEFDCSMNFDYYIRFIHNNNNNNNDDPMEDKNQPEEMDINAPAAQVEDETEF